VTQLCQTAWTRWKFYKQ